MRADILAEFELDPTRIHLNHGSFGAVARRARDEQERWRAYIEADPLHFYRVEAPAAVADVRSRVADFLGAQADSIALVRNVTEAAGAVLRATGVCPGTEVVVSDHGYGAVRLAAESLGATVRTATLTFGQDDTSIAQAFADQVTDRTVLVVVDQITSPTAWRLPAAAVAAAVAPLPVYVDGAHAAGTLQTDFDALGAAFWATNLHKWAFTPRGAGALWVAPQWRDRVAPPSPGWGSPDGFPASFDRPGTIDLTGWLAIPTALHVWRQLGGERIASSAEALLTAGARVVAEALGTAPAHPAACAPTMRIVALPEGAVRSRSEADALYQRLHERGFECQIVGERGLLRLSAAPYNEAPDYELCAAVIRGQLIGRKRVRPDP